MTASEVSEEQLRMVARKLAEYLVSELQKTGQKNDGDARAKEA